MAIQGWEMVKVEAKINNIPFKTLKSKLKTEKSVKPPVRPKQVQVEGDQPGGGEENFTEEIANVGGSGDETDDKE